MRLAFPVSIYFPGTWEFGWFELDFWSLLPWNLRYTHTLPLTPNIILIGGASRSGRINSDGEFIIRREKRIRRENKSKSRNSCGFPLQYIRDSDERDITGIQHNFLIFRNETDYALTSWFHKSACIDMNGNYLSFRKLKDCTVRDNHAVSDLRLERSLAPKGANRQLSNLHKLLTGILERGRDFSSVDTTILGKMDSRQRRKNFPTSRWRRAQTFRYVCTRWMRLLKRRTNVNRIDWELVSLKWINERKWRAATRGLASSWEDGWGFLGLLSIPSPISWPW